VRPAVHAIGTVEIARFDGVVDCAWEPNPEAQAALSVISSAVAWMETSMPASRASSSV
jgi:hypothetical protein